MPDYSKGKIYKITGSGLIYIGSTVQTLSRRMSKHISEKKVGRKCASNLLIGLDDCMITLIEDYPCERKEQLLMRERYYYDLYDCVNLQSPIRNEEDNLAKRDYQKKYYENNKENYLLYLKKYYNDNKEIIINKRNENKEKKKEYMKLYCINNREHLNLKKKEWRQRKANKQIENLNNSI